jgi:mono/diheme cytochrome c family protein
MKGNNKNASKLGVAIGAAVLLTTACNNVPNSPGWEYMPDMYRSSSYEANSKNGVFADSLTNRPSVAGTLSQGWVANAEYNNTKMVYPYKNDNEGYEQAGLNLKNPIPATPQVIEQGKEKFEKYCMHCHGATGMGDGAVVSVGNFPPPPAYSSAALKSLPEGKMFHTLQYGKGMMGSHASQLSAEDRWKIIRYVQTLQNPGGVATASADSLNTTKVDSLASKETASVATTANQNHKK